MKEALLLKGKKIGEIDTEKRCYIAHRTEEHVFRKFGNGFGLSVKVIDFLYSKDVEFIIINFENRKMFWIEIDRFVIKGEKYIDGNDEQIILPLEFWKTEEDINKTQIIQKHLNT